MKTLNQYTDELKNEIETWHTLMTFEEILELFDYCNAFYTKGYGWQMTPMSSLWLQLFVPQALWAQSKIVASLPLQLTSSNQIWPDPAWSELLPPVYPRLRQTTRAKLVLVSAVSSQTVPQTPLWRTSTRPDLVFVLPSLATSRITPEICT